MLINGAVHGRVDYQTFSQSLSVITLFMGTNTFLVLRFPLIYRLKTFYVTCLFFQNICEVYPEMHSAKTLIVEPYKFHNALAILGIIAV